MSKPVYAKKTRLTELLEDFVRRENFLSLPLLGVRVDHLGEEKSERKIDKNPNG